MKKIFIICALIIFATNLSAQILSADKGIKTIRPYCSGVSVMKIRLPPLLNKQENT
jgi:hypothetical protein